MSKVLQHTANVPVSDVNAALRSVPLFPRVFNGTMAAGGPTLSGLGATRCKRVPNNVLPKML